MNQDLKDPKALQLPTDDEILAAMANTNLGLQDSEKVPYLKNGLLKTACGYNDGPTLSEILVNLDLIVNVKSQVSQETLNPPLRYALTLRGQYSCWEWFKL